MKYDVFISYSRKDQVVVDEIRQLLDSNAITYWLDTEKVHMGSEFMADIVDAIENSTITLFISSSATGLETTTILPTHLSVPSFLISSQMLLII